MTKKEKDSKKAKFCGKFPDATPNSGRRETCKILLLLFEI